MSKEKVELEYKYLNPEGSKLPQDLTKIIGWLNVDLMKSVAAPLVDALSKYKYVTMTSSGAITEPDTVSKIRKGSTTKTNLTNFLKLFLTQENFHFFLEVMPDNLVRLLKAVAERHGITLDEAHRLYGEEVKLIPAYYYKKSMEGFLDFWFTVEYDYVYTDNEREYENCVYLACNSLYQILHYVWRRDSHPIVTLPEGLRTFSAEASVFNELPILDTLYNNNLLKVSSNKLRTATYFKTLTNLQLTDFASSDVNPAAPDSCSRAMYYPLIYAMYHKEYMPAKVKEGTALICDIFNFMLRDYDDFFKYYLPHLSGIKRPHIELSDVRYFMMHLKLTLRHIGNNKWISINDFCNYMRSIPPMGIYNTESAFCIIDEDIINRTRIENKFAFEWVGYTDVVKHLAIPAVRSVLYACASLGLLEVAYTPSLPKDAVSPFDTLQYVKLTNLGKYVVGILDTYKSPVIEESELPFALDEDHLLIKVTNPKSMKVQLVNCFAEQVTPTLYKVDETLFIKECKTPTDLKNKIEQFNQVFGNEQPQVWQDFKARLLKQSEALSRVKEQYVLLHIPPTDRRLQEIILSDSKLKKYIFRAEGYLILVEETHLNEVSRIFRSYGYLL